MENFEHVKWPALEGSVRTTSLLTKIKNGIHTARRTIMAYKSDTRTKIGVTSKE